MPGIVCTTLLALLLGAAAAAQEPQDTPDTWANSAFSADPERQFDFWVGEWDVNLRILQDDLTWKDSIAARAEIRSILDGHAILELWDSAPIVGYSLRYYDAARGTWVLWLNWPGRNSSGSSSLEGAFRHGRGEFFSVAEDAQGQPTITRYTFSDVSPTSLRWDDATSSDGGRSWRASWRMEFSRTAEQPRDLPGETAHTWQDGQRCDRDEFRRYEFLAGAWRGTLTRPGGPGSPIPATGRDAKVLGGCALLGFREAGELQTFMHLTYNTYADVYELTLLDNQGAPVRLYYGQASDEGLDLAHAPSPGAAPTHRWVLRAPDADGNVLEQLLQAGDDGSWVLTAEWRLTR